VKSFFAPPSGVARQITLLGLVALTAQQMLLWWLYYHDTPKVLVGDEHYYLQTARAILAGAPWHTSHIWPPGQSVLLAATFWLFGDSLVPIQIFQTVLFFACGFLLWRLWCRLSGNILAAGLAASLFILNPSTAAYSQYLWPEIPHLFALLLAFNFLLPRPATRFSAFFGGASIGLALLFKSLLTGIWPLFLLLFIQRKPSWEIHWTRLSLFLTGLILITAPAIIAGHRNTGHWSIADSSAFNILAGLNDRARNDYVDEPVGTLFHQYLASGTNGHQRNEWAKKEIEKKIQMEGVGEILWKQLKRQYFRLFESKTLLLSHLPGPTCGGYLNAYQAVPAPGVSVVRWTSHFFHALTLVGFAFGLCLWRGWRKPWFWGGLIFIGYQLGLFLLLHVKARYLLPLLPLFCVFAGEAFSTLWKKGFNQAYHNIRLFISLLISFLLLFLAFAGPWLDSYCWG
jgi:hypothetical protein